MRVRNRVQLKILVAAAAATVGFSAINAGSVFAAGATWNTVGTLNPNSTMTYSNATGFTANGAATQVTLSAFTTMVSTQFSSNYGGVINFDPGSQVGTTPAANTITGESVANAITGVYGTSATGSMKFYRSDTSSNGGQALDWNNNQGALVASDPTDGSYLGIQGSASFTLAFLTPITAFGFTSVARNGGTADSAGTFVLTFSDGTTAAESSGTVVHSTATGVFFGFQAPAGANITSAAFTSTGGGNSRFDDLAFVVPEPTSLSLLGTGSILLLRRRRNRSGVGR